MSSSFLKLLALFFMIIDHIGFYFIKNEELNTLFRTFGRISAPLFFFTFTIGFIYTSNREKYKKRLLISALIMEFGKILLRYTFEINITANILFTLFLSFLFLENLEKLKEHKTEKTNSIVILIILILLFNYAEYSYLALLCITIFYFYNKYSLKYNKNKCDIFLFLIYSLISIIYPIITNRYTQIFMIISIIPILYYNKKQGYNNKFIKNFYYIFYILHVFIFAILNKILM